MASFKYALGSHWAVLLSTLVEISLVSVDNLWKSCGKVRDGSGKVSVFGENFRQIVEKLEVAVEKILCSVENRGLVVDFCGKVVGKVRDGSGKVSVLVKI